MPLSFEVTDRDIAGRLGKLKVGGKTVRTPALLPVINPHLQPVTPREMQEMGVSALITNAYIFYRSSEFRDRALAEGLHRVLDFDGVIMTDSGSFQLSVYGDIAISNLDTLRFQQDIGSDILVPLDIPTSPDADRECAGKELDITLDRLREAMDAVEDRERLAGPVQGGCYTDLREEAGRKVGDLGFLFCPVGAVVPLMESYRYRELVRVVLAAKRGIPRNACVHLFGAGHPAMFALAVAMGCDLFDSAAYALYAKQGRYLTTHGSIRCDELTELPCTCSVCRQYTAEELNRSPERTRLIALHNLYVSLAELARIRQAIQDGVLWELLDERCRSHPQLLRGYRELIGHAGELEAFDRVSKRRFFYQGAESCRRTEVVRYQNMLKRFTTGKRVLIAFGGKPDRNFDDTFMFKPPFGPYPPGLGETFPIGQCETPDWDDDMVRQGCVGISRLIESHRESRFCIRCNSGWAELVRKEIPDTEVLLDDV